MARITRASAPISTSGWTNTNGNVGYTAKRKPIEYLWSDEFAHLDDAYAVEKQIKGWSRAKKEALMRGEWAEVQRLSRFKGKS